MVLFYNLLDVSALNAFIIWIHLNPNWMNGILYKRRIFLTELGKQLVRDNAARRAVKSPISLALLLQGQTQAQLLERNVVVVRCVHDQKM